jgi:hypothetical protein
MTPTQGRVRWVKDVEIEFPLWAILQASMWRSVHSVLTVSSDNNCRNTKSGNLKAFVRASLKYQIHSQVVVIPIDLE